MAEGLEKAKQLGVDETGTKKEKKNHSKERMNGLASERVI
jgi:hypothetical protein